MRALLVLVIMVVGIGSLETSADDRLKLDQSQYTCTELKEVLSDYGSIWVRLKLTPNSWINIAEENPVCYGGGVGHPRAICRWFEGRVTARDGRCKLGVECTCRVPDHRDR